MGKTIWIIGGSPCSGKSTVAERLARELGAAYFKVDDYLMPFIATAAERGKRHCSAWSRMTADEIWMRDPTTQHLDECGICREIAPQVFEALSEIPSDFIITEGDFFSPRVMLWHNPLEVEMRYLCIVPTPEFQISHYRRRFWVADVLKDCTDKERAFDNWMQRDILEAEDVEGLCAVSQIVCLKNDGSQSEDELYARVKALFESPCTRFMTYSERRNKRREAARLSDNKGNKMKILVSACLTGEKCKYNGGSNYNEKLMRFLAMHEVVTVCPEVMGGLPTPRIPCEIVNGTVLNRDGKSCDEEYRRGAEIALEIARREQIDVAILQSRSPSCGVKQVYDGSFSGTLRDGQGIFAEAAIKSGFRVLDVADWEQLLDVRELNEEGIPSAPEHARRVLTEYDSPDCTPAGQNFEIVKLADRPELLDQAVDWFSSKWGVPAEAYRESMEDSMNAAVPSWYLCLNGDNIIGGMGVIENDFHDRPDLTPNVCAVYTEPFFRCRGIAGRLLDFVVCDMHAHGIDTLYLLTDHDSFYERYGWEYFCPATSDGEEAPSRMYRHQYGK